MNFELLKKLEENNKNLEGLIFLDNKKNDDKNYKIYTSDYYLLREYITNTSSNITRTNC